MWISVLLPLVNMLWSSRYFAHTFSPRDGLMYCATVCMCHTYRTLLGFNSAWLHNLHQLAHKFDVIRSDAVGREHSFRKEQHVSLLKCWSRLVQTIKIVPLTLHLVRERDRLPGGATCWTLRRGIVQLAYYAASRVLDETLLIIVEKTCGAKGLDLRSGV